MATGKFRDLIKWWEQEIAQVEASPLTQRAYPSRLAKYRAELDHVRSEMLRMGKKPHHITQGIRSSSAPIAADTAA